MRWLRSKPALVPLGLVVLAALLASCGGASERPSPAIRSIEEILAGPVEIVDLATDSAVVRADTTIDVVCSVVFGKDERYGSQSTDPDMGGLPHGQHRAPLRGLEPDTVYHYRLQGSGPDGTIYASDDLTFRTATADDEGTDYGNNVASLGAGARVVEASSAFGSGSAWAAGNAIDGDPGTEWSSAGDGDAAFITMELAEPHELTAVGFWTRTMGSTAQTSRFQVVTGDGTILGPFAVPDASRMHVFPVSVLAQVLRFEVVTSSGGNTGAVEIAAFAGE